jgi:hypothetical protein
VGNRSGQLDVAHALAAHLATGDLDAAAVADDALVADLLVLAAMAFPVLGRAEDLSQNRPSAFGLECSVVDGFRFFDLATGPFEDLLGGSQTDPMASKLFISNMRAVSFLTRRRPDRQLRRPESRRRMLMPSRNETSMSASSARSTSKCLQ